MRITADDYLPIAMRDYLTCAENAAGSAARRAVIPGPATSSRPRPRRHGGRRDFQLQSDFPFIDFLEAART